MREERINITLEELIRRVSLNHKFPNKGGENG
jgi:hypothetical protein